MERAGCNLSLARNVLNSRPAWRSNGYGVPAIIELLGNLLFGDRPMRSSVLGFTLIGLSAITLAGCTEKSTVNTETTVKTPEGTTKVTTEQTVEKSGENPPPARP